MAKAQERDHVFTVFLHVIPLRRFPVQNKVDILFILFHTVFKKVKTIFLRGDTEFFVDQPYMTFPEEFTEYFINSKSGQFLYSETESVMWLPVTASEQETVTGAAHREIHEITPTDIVPSEKECKTDFAVKNGCVNSIGSCVLKNQCPVTVILFQKRGVNL